MSIQPLGLGSLVCLALLAAQPPAQQSAEKMTVEGAVVDASTGLPIERALVTLGPESQFTGPDGRFVFQDQSVGRSLNVAAVRPGYARATEAAMSSGERRSLTIKLKRYAEITGKVLNEDGEPVQGLRVQAYRRSIESGRVRLTSSAFWTTDDLGFFRLAEMPAGDYLVRVAGRAATFAYLGEGGGRLPGSDEAYIARFYPGVADQSAAQVLKMESGQALQIDFTMPSRPAVSIRGRIVNHVPYQPVTLQLSRPGELPMGNRVRINAASGEFEIHDVPAGQYELSAKRTINEAEERGRITVQVGNAQVNGVNVTLTRPVDIEVVLHGMEPERQLRYFDLALTPSDSSSEDEAVTADIDKSSKLGLKGVWPGSYRLRMAAYPGARYVSAVTSGGVDLLREGLTVPEGSAPPPIEIQLVPGPAQLELTVVAGGKPVSSANAMVFSGHGESWRLERSGSIQRGAFAVYGLAPGTYGVLVVPEDLDIEYENPQVMERFASRITRVTVRAGAKESLQLELAQEAQD